MTNPTNEPLIRVENLRKSFGSLLVLKDIDFAVMPGEVVTIIGASGSGKSTLLRCMNLLETPDRGHIWFHGEDLAADRVNINRLREKIGMVFQSFNLFNNKNVLDNCTLAPITLKKMSREEMHNFLMRYADGLLADEDNKTIDLPALEDDLRQVKGIGAKRLEEIMTIIEKHLDI